METFYSRNDLSDLITNIKWCLQNKNEAKKIAENAYEFSKKYLTRDACYYRWNKIIGDEIKKVSLTHNYKRIRMLTNYQKIYFYYGFKGGIMHHGCKDK